MPDERSEDSAEKDAAKDTASAGAASDTKPAAKAAPPSDQAEGIFSRYGIASAVLGVVAAVAVVVATWVYLGHRADDKDRVHEAQAMKAAADWAGLLINMTKDNVAVNVPKLHEGTVGQLNADFDATVAPFTQLVQKLQSQTTGQIESVALETLHHAPPGEQGKPAVQPELAAISSDTTTVLVIATSVSQNAGAKPQTVRWRLRLGVSDVGGKLLISRLETLR
ncbi:MULTISPECIES: hypothetical protein [unclassified Mycobacterium]|uniref:hypothetical protein n=1 Tax=unclassified Mycobacterium TaxID=2642494 RepID=UPI00036E8A61|nr:MULTISPECIES: hypothetical protein [unclassified Mycobacterium]SEB24571.1 hypothetical protein SAMN04488580_11449 [Mycobacterium sp. 283mftsu]